MLIQAKNLNVSFSQKKILTDISLEILGPGLIAFLGKNGTGKSTLLRCLSGVNEDLTSQVFINNKNLEEITLEQRAKTLAWSPAETQVTFAFTVIDVLRIGFYPWNDESILEQGLQKITRLLKLFAMEEFLQENYSSLSSGERKIINLIRVLSTPHMLVILDEPTAFLDLDNIIKVFQLLSEEAKLGKTIFLATHDIREAYDYCDQMILLKKGRIQAHCKQKHKKTIEELRNCFELQNDWFLNQIFKEKSISLNSASLG